MRHADYPKKYIALILIVIGLFITGSEFYIKTKGGLFCPFSGCRLAEASSFSHFLGVDLFVWGFVYFLISAFLLYTPWLFYWLCIGVGVSLYLIVIQIFVLKQLCAVCILIEILTFILLALFWRKASILNILTFTVVAFLGTHAGYTWDIPAELREENTIACVSWGDETADAKFEYFFEFECPACEEGFSLLQNWVKEKKAKVIFRMVGTSKDVKKASLFLSLIKKGHDPFEAFELVKKEKSKGKETNIVKYTLEKNKELLLALGFEKVPVLFVKEKGCLKAYEGLNMIKEFFENEKSSILFFSPLSFERGRSCSLEGCN